MINFFRKIRKKMADDNKPMKYLRYAIGEIALVVIGILIALQINNWNNEQAKLKLGSTYLMEIKNEVEADVYNIDYFIRELESSIAKREKALRTEDLHSLSFNSLSYIFNSQNLDFNVNQLTFEKIKNLGITRLSTNDSLNDMVNIYYNEEAVFFKKFINYHFESLKNYQNFMHYGEHNIDFGTAFSSDYNPYPALYKDLLEEKNLKSKYMIEFLQSSKGKTIIFNNLRSDRDASHRFKYFLGRSLNILNLIIDDLEKKTGVIIDRTNLPVSYDLTEIEIPEDELRKYTGKYQFTTKQINVITQEGTQLFLQYSEAGTKHKIYAYEEDKFFHDYNYVKLHFISKNGIVTGINAIQFSFTEEGKKIE